MKRKDLAGKRMPRGGPPGRGQGPRHASALALALTLLLLCGAAGRAAAVSRIDRPGVYALGVWGQYGFVEGKEPVRALFRQGRRLQPSFSLQHGRHTALTVYFDNHTYDAKTDSLLDFRMTAVHAGLRFFSIPTGDVLRYAEVTVGFYRPEIRRPKTISQSIGEDVSFPGEGSSRPTRGRGRDLLHPDLGRGTRGAWVSALRTRPDEGRRLQRGGRPDGHRQAVGGITYYLLR